MTMTTSEGLERIAVDERRSESDRTAARRQLGTTTDQVLEDLLAGRIDLATVPAKFREAYDDLRAIRIERLMGRIDNVDYAGYFSRLKRLHVETRSETVRKLVEESMNYFLEDTRDPGRKALAVEIFGQTAV